MPRLSSMKVQYKQKDFVRWLAGEMKVQNIRQKDIAEWLNISQVAVCNKLNDYSFTFTDMLMIFQELKTDKETQIRLMTL